MMPASRSNKATLVRRDSLGSLFATLEKPLLAYAYRITAEREMAQDIVQDAFLSYQRSEAEIESPRAWLYRTVRNLGINAGKRKSRECSFEESDRRLEGQEWMEADTLPPARLERNEMIGITHLLIEELDERSREVVSLKFLEGRNYREIAERTGLSVSNVGFILHKAVRSLADEFERLGLSK